MMTSRYVYFHTFSCYILFTELLESSKGVGFTAETMERAANLVEGEDLDILCYVTKVNCTASKVEIIATSGDAMIPYRKDSSSTKWSV